MFSLTDQQVKIKSFNPRSEKHGPNQNVLAGDLSCETNMHSSVLDLFDKGLRKLLYRKPAPGEQSELPLGDSNDGLTARKLPNLAPLRFEEAFPGYTIAIQTGLALNEAIEIDDVELSSFVVEALDGGSCKVSFRASFHPDGKTSGKLCQLIQDTCEMTLTPPTAEEQKQRELEKAEAA